MGSAPQSLSVRRSTVGAAGRPTLPCHPALPRLPRPRRRSANVSPPSLAADMLCGAMNVIAFSWIASPAATELEAVRG